MTTLKATVEWIQRGRQKQAVAKALCKPLTESEIWAKARTDANKIQLRDVWAILKEMKQRNLVYCLNPEVMNGKTYYYTELGSKVVKRAFSLNVQPLPGTVNWRKYGKIARGKVRRRLLAEIAADEDKADKTAADIWKAVREKYPLGFNVALKTLKDLQQQGLITFRRNSARHNRKCYETTAIGKRIARQLRGNSEPFVGNAF